MSKFSTMKQIEKTKEDDFNQMLLLDENALIVESCDTLFETQSFSKKPVINWSPFVESIFDYLLTLKSGSPEILFSRVEEPLAELPGFYDFTFGVIKIENKRYILWTIFDYTNLYTELQRTQQRMHEIEIQRQNLTYKFHQILKKNLLLQTNRSEEDQHSLLLQANNAILLNTLKDLEQIADLMKNQMTSKWSSKFSLGQLLDKLREKINQNQSNKLLINIHGSIPKLLIGDRLRLLYILFDLLSLSNFKNTIASYLKIDFSKPSNEQQKALEFTVFNANLQGVVAQNQSLNEISLVGNSSLQLKIEIIKKLIDLHFGQFNDINLTPKGSYFQFSLPFGMVSF